MERRAVLPLVPNAPARREGGGANRAGPGRRPSGRPRSRRDSAGRPDDDRPDTGDQWVAQTAGWRALGASHIGIITLRAGRDSAQAHNDALRRVKERLDG